MVSLEIIGVFLIGCAISGLLVWTLMRRSHLLKLTSDAEHFQRKIEHSEQLHQAAMDAKLNEIENLNAHFQAQKLRLSVKEDALQLALLSEVELKTSIGAQEKQHEEKIHLLEQARLQLGNEFKTLAADIFEAKQKTFKEQSQSQLDSVLKPLGEKIKDFEKRVEDHYNNESKERFSLVKEVKSLQELNARISKDAINLTNALKGESKTQGTWGEIILERVLEKSGLVKGREYEIQVNLKTETGRRFQPDVVVHLPEEKDVVIDAKVSLTAYERYCSTDDGIERELSLKQHIQSVRQHIKTLGEKDYQNLEGVRTLDFVLLFIPVEAAFSLAVQHDGDLFASAFEKNIVLVAPSTLLATLRTIQNIWRYEQQNKNAQEIAEKAGALYDKFINFVIDLEDIGGRLNSVQGAYDKAHKKLTSGTGNLIRRAEGVRQLGAKVSKSLPKHLAETPIEKSIEERLETPTK
jgi:DNA recombination protein RmuC